MSDSELRELERRWKRSGAVSDELRFLSARWRDEPAECSFDERWRLFTLTEHDTELRRRLWPGLLRDAPNVDASRCSRPPGLTEEEPGRWGAALVVGPAWPGPRTPLSYRAYYEWFELTLDVCPPLTFLPLSLEEATRRWSVAARHPHENLAKLVGWARRPRRALLADYRGADRLLDVSARWEVDPAVRAVRALADSVSSLHAEGLVHGCIGVHYVLQRSDGSPVLAPYGGSVLASLEPDETELAEGRRAVTGLEGLPFLAPEALQTQTFDARCDVFALGALLFRLLAGSTPWLGVTEHDALQAVMAGIPATLLRSVVEDAPEGLEEVLAQALDPNPDERQRDAYVFRDDLDWVLGVRSIRSR